MTTTMIYDDLDSGSVSLTEQFKALKTNFIPEEYTSNKATRPIYHVEVLSSINGEAGATNINKTFYDKVRAAISMTSNLANVVNIGM